MTSQEDPIPLQLIVVMLVSLRMCSCCWTGWSEVCSEYLGLLRFTGEVGLVVLMDCCFLDGGGAPGIRVCLSLLYSGMVGLLGVGSLAACIGGGRSLRDRFLVVVVFLDFLDFLVEV